MDGMERLGGERMGEPSSIRQVAAASFIGTTIEWYDFFLYGTAAALVFNKLFFPEFSPLAGCWPSALTPWASWPAPSAGSSSATTATRSAARRC
jgi:hypothetical protein